MLSQIRKKLFLARDGANASSLRKKGIDYKMILGVPIVTLRKISKEYAPNAELANELWKEDHRELKILATLIQNPESFSGADDWVKDIHNLELAEQITSNLLCKLPDAGVLAKKWIQSDQTYTSITGFLLYTRLFMQNFQWGNQEDMEAYFYSVANALSSHSILLKNAALSSLKRMGRQSVIQAKYILAKFENSLFYDDLKFEFDYHNSETV